MTRLKTEIPGPVSSEWIERRQKYVARGVGNTGKFFVRNKLIFTLGPATGSGFPGVGRFGVFSRSPLTGGFAES